MERKTTLQRMTTRYDAIVHQQGHSTQYNNVVSIDYGPHIRHSNNTNQLTKINAKIREELEQEARTIVDSLSGADKDKAFKLYLLATEKNEARRFDLLMHELDKIRNPEPEPTRPRIFTQPPNTYYYRQANRTGVVYNTTLGDYRRNMPEAPVLNQDQQRAIHQAQNDGSAGEHGRQADQMPGQIMPKP